MAKRQFKAESKRLLDLMINSIYTHKEIFLRELISNASDAIDKMYYKELSDGSTGISREDFRILLEADKADRTLKIIDNGIGIPAEVIPHIFEPFFSTKHNASGIGLGLPIVHGIIQSHQGKIEVKSESGTGTTFSIVLPLRKQIVSSKETEDLV